MRLLVKNSQSMIEDCDLGLQDLLVNSLSFIDPDTGMPISVYESESNIFPTGLVPRALKVASDYGVRFEIVDLRETPPSNEIRLRSEYEESHRLREEYQVPDLETMLSSTRGIVKWPTGGGKTVLACYYFARRQCFPATFYVGSLSLLNQTVREFRSAFGEEVVGQIGDSVVDPRALTVIMIQSANTALSTENSPITVEAIRRSRSVIVDECHHVPARTVTNLLRHSTRAYYRYGFSATPFRSDGLDLLIDAGLGPRIVDRSASDLYELGYLANAEIRFRSVPHKGWDPRWTQWHTAYHDLIVHNRVRNQMIIEDIQELYNQGRRIVVFVNQVNHGRLLTKMSRDILPSHEVAFVEGEVSSDVRDQVYEKLKIGSMRVMIVTPLGDEGLDLPPVDGLILADGGKSPVEKIQQIGRGLRPFKSKINCQIRDYLDEGPIVGKHAQARLNLYSSIERSWRVSIVGTRETVAVQSKGRDVTW